MNREPAYADVVAGLLDAVPTAASEQFDAELAKAVADGLDTATARSLRWWQRESARAVREHATTVLPAVIAALVDSAATQAAQTGAPPAIAMAPPPATQAAPDPAPEEGRRRTLVAGLLALNDADTA